MLDFFVALNLMLDELTAPNFQIQPLGIATVSCMIGKGSEFFVRSTLNHAFRQAARTYVAIYLIANYDLTFKVPDVDPWVRAGQAASPGADADHSSKRTK